MLICPPPWQGTSSNRVARTEPELWFGAGMKILRQAAATASWSLLLVLLVACGSRVAPSAGVATSPTQAPVTDAIVEAQDAMGDVSTKRHPGLSAELRQGVDLRSLTLTRRAGSVRFTIGVGRVARSARLTQIYLIDVNAPGFDYGQLMVATHPWGVPASSNDGLEHSMTLEGAEAPEGYIDCSDLAISLADGADSWWVDIPRRCLPEGPARLKVYAQTVPGPGNDEPIQWSDDTLRVPGRHSLGGLAQPAKG